MSYTPPPHTGYTFPGPQNLHNDIYPSINPSLTPSLHQPGKVVLITGAGRGIGRAIALQYAHARVSCIILCARTGRELDEVEERVREIDDSVTVQKHTVDVTSASDVQAMAEKVKATSKSRLDVLVNNAGASCPWVPITDVDAKEWWSTLEVNLRGPFNFLHAFLPLLVDTAETLDVPVNVVNVTSIGAHMVSPGASAYQISKLAVLRLCESVDVEFAAKGVQCVGVHPGGVLTTMSEKVESLRPMLNDTPELCGGFIVWLTAQQRAWLNARYVSATWDVDALVGMEKEIVHGNKLKMFMSV